jgi:hypothetical protein
MVVVLALAGVAPAATPATPMTPKAAAPMQRAAISRGKQRRGAVGREGSFERMTGLLLRGASSVEFWEQLPAKLTPDGPQF